MRECGRSQPAGISLRRPLHADSRPASFRVLLIIHNCAASCCAISRSMGALGSLGPDQGLASIDELVEAKSATTVLLADLLATTPAHLRTIHCDDSGDSTSSLRDKVIVGNSRRTGQICKFRSAAEGGNIHA